MQTFDPQERRRQKQAAREQDDADLRNGVVTLEQLARRNSFFYGVFDMKNATIIRRKRI